MKKILLSLLAVSIFTLSMAQTTIPTVTIKTVDGKPFITSDIKNDGPILLIFGRLGVNLV